MKNIKLYEELRQQCRKEHQMNLEALELNEQAKHRAWLAWREDRDNKEKEEEFSDYVQTCDKIRRRIEQIEGYLGDKWYMTEYLYTDSHAYEVVEVYSWNKMAVRRLDATLTEESKKALQESFVPGGFCGYMDNSLQEYTYKSSDHYPIEIVRRHKDGKFYRPNTRTCPLVVESEPNEYRDFNL